MHDIHAKTVKFRNYLDEGIIFNSILSKEACVITNNRLSPEHERKCIFSRQKLCSRQRKEFREFSVRIGFPLLYYEMDIVICK